MKLSWSSDKNEDENKIGKVPFLHEGGIKCFIATILSVILVILMSSYAETVSSGSFWWVWTFFVFLDGLYIVYGYTRKRLELDACDVFLVMAGPLTFYFWVFLGAWKKYIQPILEDRNLKAVYLRSLIWDLRHEDLVVGFDFQAPLKFKDIISNFLSKWDFERHSIYFEAIHIPREAGDVIWSVAETKEAFKEREARRR